MKITYYRDPHGGYHGITDESPKGLTGCVCVGRGPAEHGRIETVKEQAYTVKQLQQWTRVENVPAGWLGAIGYESVPETAPEPPEPRRPVETVKLDFVPWHGPILEEYMKDPIFWPLCIIIFVILHRFVRWLFV